MTQVTGQYMCVDTSFLYCQIKWQSRQSGSTENWWRPFLTKHDSCSTQTSKEMHIAPRLMRHFSHTLLFVENAITLSFWRCWRNWSHNVKRKRKWKNEKKELMKERNKNGEMEKKLSNLPLNLNKWFTCQSHGERYY